MKHRISMWHKDRCDLCGQCLYQCPVLTLSLDEARVEMKNLIEGNGSRYVLTNCTSCMSCNIYCPRQANPYHLIQERWNDLYHKKGAPPLYRGVCPTEEPNIWQLLNVFLSEKEKRWISGWMNYVPQPGDMLLLIGNYVHLFPFIIGDSQLLNYFKVVDRIDQWEGGAYLYQGGYLDEVQRIAHKTKEDFDRWGVNTVVPLLDAVYHVFTQVHPKEMQVKHEQTFINFHDWLLEKFDSGDIDLPNQLNISITVHDNCYSKALGEPYWDKHREILKRCGCILVEMEHNRQNSLCCGFGAGASWKRNSAIPFDMIWEATKKIKEAETTGAKALVSYCGGCIYLLWATRELLQSKIDIYHNVEIVRMAMGETINYPYNHIERAWDIIAIITYQLLVSIFQKNFRIKTISYDYNRSTFTPKNYRVLKIIRKLLRYQFIRGIYSKIFKGLMPVINTRRVA